MQLTGTFLDEISHDIPHQNWGEAEWDQDFQHMKAIGIDTVILIRCGYQRWLTYPSEFLSRQEGAYLPPVDLVALFLDLAAKYGMVFYFGLYDSGKYWWEQGDYAREVNINLHVIDEVWARYGAHPAFGGWYLCQEVSRKTGQIIELYRQLGHHCKDLSGGLPTLISPYIQGKKAILSSREALAREDAISLEEHEREWEEIFAGIGEVVDIVAFQDGHVEYHELADYFAVNKALADRHGIRCWTNAESFDRDMPIKFLPIKWEKLKLKLEAASRAGLEKAITFEFSHFMSPQSSYSQARHLFNRYREWAKLLGLLLLVLTGCAPGNSPEKPHPGILSYVDPMIGTGFHGHTFPGPVVPHGRVQLGPDTHIMGWEASSGYHFDDTTLYGFSHTHLSGTGIGDMGDILFLPFTGAVPEAKPVGVLDHNGEHASAGYYRLDVLPWRVRAELTASNLSGWHRYTYPKGEKPWLMIDLGHVLQPNWGHKIVESSMEQADAHTIKGYRMTSGWAAEDPIWFHCSFDRPIESIQWMVDGDLVEGDTGFREGQSVTALLSFGADTNTLEAQVAISSVDSEGAFLNHKAVLESFVSFDEVRRQAEKQWTQELSKILIETEHEATLKNFYTALYHSKIAPMHFQDVDGRYRGIDRQVHQAEPGQVFTVYSLWDVFRSWYPLMTLIEPMRARLWARDLYRQYQDGGVLPKWALNGNYTGTMVGYPAVAVLADAITKGLPDLPAAGFLQAAIKSSTWQEDFYLRHRGSRAEMVMPRQIYFKEKQGFVPMDSCNGSVSYGLEMAYYDWCVARLAEKAGEEKIREKYDEKGKAYRHYFDPESGFMRGKNSDGSRLEVFNPRHSDHAASAYIEGNAWQWTPLVLHDLPGFADLLGGREELGQWLDSLFTTESLIEGENASSDITGLIGQYAHGNEPSHHVPYIYQYSDRPWRTQEVLDKILYEFYQPTPEGIIGNEDCGQMSAWYILNALGVYQVAPGDPTWHIGRPIVDRARIRMQDGWFTIAVENQGRENFYIGEVTLNGVLLEDLTLQFSDFKPGGILRISMTDVREEG